MPPCAETDGKAKSSVRASSRAARPGAVSVPVAVASKPGAVAVPVGEAARLDDRIAQKQRKAAPGSPTVGGELKPAAVAGSPTNGQVVRRVHSGPNSGQSASSRVVPSRTASGTPTLNADVMAKQQGRKPAPGVASKPGSFRVASNGGSVPPPPPPGKPPSTAASPAATQRVEVSQMERDAAAKNAARRPPAPTVSQMERDAAAKNAARRPPAPTASQTERDAAAKNAARRTPDAAIQRKIRTMTSMGSSSGSDISRKNQVDSLDDRIASKVRAADVGRGTSRATPASLNGHSFNSIDSDVAAKRMAVDPLASPNPGGHGVQSKQKESGSLAKNATAAVRKASIPPRGFDSKEDTAAESKKAGAGVGVAQSKSAEKDPTSKMLDQGEDMEFGAIESGEERGGLAIAIAIEEDDDDMFIPSAVEYDPDAKPPLHQNRRFRLYAFLAFFALMAAAGGAVVGVVLTRDTEPVDDTPYREKVGIRERIEKLIGKEELAKPDSPYSKATEWIIYQDPMELEPEEANFIQRYTMAYFYYATTVDGPWLSCNPPVGDENHNCNHTKLVAVFPNAYQDVPNATRWLSSAHECEFAGVMCDDKLQVRHLEMDGQEMSGSFPGGIVNLPFLQSIAFSWSGLSGPLPKDIVGMKHLVNIEMQYNTFTGSIPEEWWQARNLIRISLGNNLLTGSIPPEVKDLKDIKGLFLQDNKFSGSLPKEIGDLASLTYLRLSGNTIVGQIPTEVGNLKRLEEFWLHKNNLTGTLPLEIGDMELMTDFRVHMNSELGGDIPDSFYNMTNLMRADLNDCNFTGTISPLIGNLTQLYDLSVNGNAAFGGQVPREMAQLYLGALEIQGTNITGKMPDGICSQRGPEALVDLIADCAVDAASGTIRYQCDCCSECCDGEGVCTPTANSKSE